MIAELLELNQKAGGCTPLILVAMKYHTIWQEWAPGEILCKFRENSHKVTNTNKSWYWDSE